MLLVRVHGVCVHGSVSVFVCVCINAGMPDCPASGQSSTGLKKLTMLKQVRYRTKLTQSGIFLVRYRTKIRDAGMPMPALVSSMPMPSYACPFVFLQVSKVLERLIRIHTNLPIPS